MEKLVVSRINPHVGASCSVQCNSCSCEVKPAMSIERGYEVEAVSLVEPLELSNSPKKKGTNGNGVPDRKIINGETEVKSLLPDGNTVEVEDCKAKEISEEEGVIEENTSPDDTVEDDSDTPSSDETIIQKSSSSSGTETIVQKSSSGESSEFPNQDSEQSDSEEDSKDVDKVQEIYIVLPSKYKRINIALDKARFCLLKTNCTTMKTANEVFQEGIAHVYTIKKLLDENIPREGSLLIDDLSFISKELFKDLEALNNKILDCQLESLMNTVDTLKQDLETELANLDKIEPEKVEPNEFEMETPASDALNFLKDATCIFLGLISLLATNLGFFSQPWLFQSVHTSVMTFSGYLKNVTFW